MESRVFILKNKKEEVPGIFTLEFIPANETIFDFKAGQFALLQILKKDFAGVYGKAYTITSLLGDEFLTFAVKRIGIFSNALCDLEIGDEVKATGPYGNFYPVESDKKDIVFLAGGIGITPFYAVIKDFYKRAVDRKIILFFSNRNKSDIAFFEELKKISDKWKNLEIIHILTREKEKVPGVKEYERLNIEMLKKYFMDLGGKDYFICGPPIMMKTLQQQLETQGVKETAINFEDFSF